VAVLETHAGVREVAVVGAPDERWGEVGVAHVVLDAGAAVTADELDALARGALADFKVPRRYVFRDDPLPRTASGKVQKYELEEAQ
jgi:fatty-acyl-CoA synthase